METIPQSGEVSWIGIRPEKRAPLAPQDQVVVSTRDGLAGDHYQGRSGNRQVTLIQYEHIRVVESILGKEIDPSWLRRNLVIKGINLNALKDQRVLIGEHVVLEITGLCHPCSRMEENLGSGGYQAMRGHGGITARVVHDGLIKIGDQVKMIEN